MAFSRRLGVVSILGACWFVAIGCGDEEDRKNGTEDGGEGGEGTGGGGKSSAGGDKNISGKGGSTAGKGGTSGGKGGSAGSSSGGVGEAGSGAGGEAGGGGIVAGAGGEGTPGGAGEGGAPGGLGGAPSAGAGGEGGAPEPQVLSCRFECETPAECAVLEICDAETHRCVNPLEPCATKGDCVPFASNWGPLCENSAGCDGLVCVEWQGEGYCAVLADGFCFPGVETALPERGGQGDVSVCVASGACNQGTCQFACDHEFFDPPCADAGLGDTCNPTTGLCDCADGGNCDSGVCGADSRCVECVTPDHCGGAQFGLDACVNGSCGCSSVAVCSTTGRPNTVPHCE